ncbi:MauE/DoxX family redox-associated membrane protein [Mycolicibacterium sp.]|uniref:DoxX family protein n=1 Tax=Mycolicibacterium sp. TaxID=2320850 RepID=UPI0028A9D6B4|nr:MauE/DoxX family redox-associated membrane protein [Mycolicibacterium sp.]
MPDSASEPVSQRPAYRMGAMLIGIGAGHFLAPKPFDTIVPAELPGNARFYTLASGVAEMGVGAMLLVPRTRRAGALAAAALYLAVLPANLNMVRMWRDKPLPMRIAALARLPLQVPMVTQALAIRRNAPRRG